jgi:enterochelin esterase-like enzyme
MRPRPVRVTGPRLAALVVAALLAGCTAAGRPAPTVAPTTPPATEAPPTPVPATATPEPEPTAPPEPTSGPIRPAPPTPPAVVATPDARPGGGIVRQQVFHSPAFGQDMSYLIYLPPGYEESDRPYPTLYLLHGVAGDSTEWPSIGVPDAADELIAAGAIQPMLIVFPYGDAGYYVNNANGGLRWEDHLVQDVTANVDATYRSLPRPESRAIGGLSMGGDGALHLAMRHPEIFGVAAAHSPSSRLLFEHVAPDVYGDEPFFRAHNPFWLAQGLPTSIPVRFWIDVGDDDPWRWNASAIHFALEARGIPHEFHILPGTHDGEYWIAHTPEYLRYYGRTLAGP